MLIEKPLSTGDVCTLKLTSGEEIVARFEEENDETITISKATCLIPQGNGMGFAPWIMTVEARKFTLNKNTVTLCLPSVDHVAKLHTEATSEIAIATK